MTLKQLLFGGGVAISAVSLHFYNSHIEVNIVKNVVIPTRDPDQKKNDGSSDDQSRSGRPKSEDQHPTPEHKTDQTTVAPPGNDLKRCREAALKFCDSSPECRSDNPNQSIVRESFKQTCLSGAVK